MNGLVFVGALWDKDDKTIAVGGVNKNNITINQDGGGGGGHTGEERRERR